MMAGAIAISSELHPGSVHRLAPGWRWLCIVAGPLLALLMAVAGLLVLQRQQSGEGETGLWAAVLTVCLLGGLALMFLAAAAYAIRARVIIAGERMEVRGLFSTVTLTAGRLNGFRTLGEQLYVYLKDRAWAVQLGYFEHGWMIQQWVRTRTQDIQVELLTEEDKEIARDLTLGITEAQRSARLGALRRLVSRGSMLVYAAAGITFANFLFLENLLAEQIGVAILVLTPLFFDGLALGNPGHIRVDHDEGSRYPQIFSLTLGAGFGLALISLIDRGALLDDRFYELFVAAAIGKGLLWCLIDRQRLAMVYQRGGLLLVMTLIALFSMPMFWVGGSLYQANKHLDRSPMVWHETSVVEKTVSSGRSSSYSLVLGPWQAGRKEPVEYTLRRDEFDAFEEGQRVRVGVRDGALGMAWAAGLSALPEPSQAVAPQR